jgi:hypothetical protein
MILLAAISFIVCIFLLALYLFLAGLFAIQNRSRARRMERDARIYRARQTFYQSKSKWN